MGGKHDKAMRLAVSGHFRTVPEGHAVAFSICEAGGFNGLKIWDRYA